MNSNFPAKLARHLAQSVRTARHRYRKRLGRSRKRTSKKAVHALRIETRRILALLDLLEALHFPRSLKKLHKTFKKQLDSFDDLRDTQVQLDLLKPLWPNFPEARSLKKCLCKCEEQLVSELSKKVRATKSGRLNRQLKQLEKCLRQCGKSPGTGQTTSVAQTLLNDAFRRVFALRRNILRNQPATIHLMRVAFKRFRYTAELLQPFAPQFTAECLDHMKDFQASAGNIQDLAVLLGRIDNYVKSGQLPATHVQNLRAELLRQERRRIDSFMSRVGELMKFEPEHSNAFLPDAETASK